MTNSAFPAAHTWLLFQLVPANIAVQAYVKLT
jgi:hypothetical protein